MSRDSSRSEQRRGLHSKGHRKRVTSLCPTPQADGEVRQQRVRAVLAQMSAPKQWRMSDGGVAQVHTPFTARAKELADLYSGLMLQGLGVDERLDVLLHIKWAVTEFKCGLTREMVELIDREATLVSASDLHLSFG